MTLPPLLLLHGYPFDHTMWNAVAALLRPKTEVITPDLPGFGATPVSTAEPSLEIMADYVLEIYDQAKIKSAVVAGMSMGGYIALAFAEKYPEKLAGLGLISTHCWADSDEVRQSRRDMIEKVKQEGPQAVLPGALSKLFAAAHQNHPAFQQFPSDGARKAGRAGIGWALEAMARRPDRSTLLQNVKLPLLILHGTEDRFMSIDRARQMAALVANAAFVEAPKAGHATPIEAPETVAGALEKLLERAK